MAIPSGLRALLSQMGLVKLGPGAGPAAQAKASAMKGEKGPATGQLLGEDGLLLAGLGYAGHDRRTDRKNLAERSNLTRYLQQQLRDGPSLAKGNLATEEGLLGQDGAEGLAESDAGADAEAREAREPRAEREVRQQERRDEARLQGFKDAAEQGEARETAEAKDAEHQHQHRDDQDEEDKPGAGWVAEENEEEGDERRQGLRTPDVLSHATRCRGVLEDGSRCLRKPTDGTPYCAEHAAFWHPVAPAASSAVDAEPTAARAIDAESPTSKRSSRKRGGPSSA